MTAGPLDAYRRKPGGGPACHICGHRFVRHESSTACLRAALLAISDALTDPTEHDANDTSAQRDILAGHSESSDR